MPDVSTMFYHGIRQNLRRVLVALGPDRVEKGLTAFEDGKSNWSECFFARAFKGEARLGRLNDREFIDPSKHICILLGDPGLKMLVPVKMLWHTFDSARSFHAGRQLTRKDLQKFISDVLDESRPSEVMDLLRSLNYENVESKEFACQT